MNKKSQPSEDRPFEIEASKWAIKQSIGFTAEEQDQFFEWLAADPEHAEAFSSRRQVWDELNSLAEWRPEHSLKPNPDLLQVSPSVERPNKTRTVLFFVGGLAALWVLGLLSWNMVNDRGTVESYKLVSGGVAQSYERYELVDGSVVELNRGAQATVEFTENNRLVSLDSGEAHFTIAKDSNRPFIVTARGVAVQAVGTVFNVQISNDSVNVLVTEGRVFVDHELDGEPIGAHESTNPPRQELEAGQRSVIDLRTVDPEPMVHSVTFTEIEQQLSWLKQVLSFQSAPLSDIVLEFNRRNFTQITIGDSEIMDLELTVALKPHNIDSFLELLELTQNIEADHIGESIIILRKKP